MRWWVFIFALAPVVVLAEAYTSSNFVLQDPVITVEGGRASSASFEYYSSTGQSAIGESSAGAFTYRSGFLYFSTVTTPVISATAGAAQVVLTWTASAEDGLGLTVEEYEVGQTTSSGGPYTFTNVGDVLTSTRTGLTNGTTYYFIVRALDSSGISIATSTEVSATPATAGGGGGGYGSGTSVTFSGRAYPNSRVTLLKDAQVVVTTVAGPDARFQITVGGLLGGSYIFSLYGEDYKGIRSSLLSFPIMLTVGASTNVGGIFISPTISVDKSVVKKGETIAIFGQSSPESEITISVNSLEPHFVQTESDEDGVYLQNFDTTPLEYGEHSTKSRATYQNEVSTFGQAVAFAVGSQSLPVQGECGRADLNCDGRVNLVDFSILAFWYRRTLSTDFALLEQRYLNGDGTVTIIDFSIMAYYWTG